MSKTKFSQHADWLSLLEVSGAFLTPKVLDDVFKLGLDAADVEEKRILRRAYDEWNDALDENARDLNEVHVAWIKFVLKRLLHYESDVLKSGENYALEFEGELEPYAPDFVLQEEGGEPLLFVKYYDPNVELSVAASKKDDLLAPIEKATKLCEKYDVRLALVTNGEAWTLVNAPVGRPSGAATWFARLWFQEPNVYRAFQTLLERRRFHYKPEERLPYLLDKSFENMEEVTSALGAQVRAAVEVLIQGLDKADADRNRELLRGVEPATLYEAGLTVMMRLVFILCAEERDLLLRGKSAVYDQFYAVSSLRSQLAEDADKYGEETLERRCDAWTRLLAVFRIVYAGCEHENMRLPALGGSLFDPDKYPFLEGRPRGTSWKDETAAPLPIDDRTVMLLLNSLQVLEQKGGATFLSYRGLDVEQIGYVYEGLLEQTAVKTDEHVLGLQGSAKAKNPIVKLSELETLQFESDEKLFKRVADITGRSTTSIKNAYAKKQDQVFLKRLKVVCGVDEELFERVKPFANWIRDDAWGAPLIYAPGSYMVCLGQDRRDSGTHYTPKALTERIVKTTLDPLLYADVDDKKTLKSPDEILNLKICDPTMGSGAFLVQACRYLGEKIVQGWNAAERNGKFVDAFGNVRDALEGREPLSNVQVDRVAAARRLVLERCVYGVDVNPLAVELAKLSLWLVTVSNGKPFSFLDHNLKSGDSLLGVTDARELSELTLEPKGKGVYSLFGGRFENDLEDAKKTRDEIRAITARNVADVEEMARLNRNARKKLDRALLFADLFVAELFAFSGSKDKLQKKLEDLAAVAEDVFNGEEEIVAKYRRDAQEDLKRDLPKGRGARRPFHWALEFPEVFSGENPGFDAMCGNPPFSGGQHITGTLGTAYRDYLVEIIADGTKGSADLVSYFFLRAFRLLKKGGVFGLVACNTIAEGDTRQVGLERLLKQGGTIIAAEPNVPWPGVAAVVISPVFMFKGENWKGRLLLNNEVVDHISAFLSEQEEWTPKTLEASRDQAFQGSIVLGSGFTVSKDEALAFIEKNPQCIEVLFPYLNGEILNSTPTQQSSRWVINFWDWPLDREAEGDWYNVSQRQKDEFIKRGSVPRNYPFKVANDFPDLLKIVRENVKPQRDIINESNSTGRRRKFFWWLYGGDSKGLYHIIGRGNLFYKHPSKEFSVIKDEYVLVNSQSTRYFIPSLVTNESVFTHTLIVFKPRCPNLFLSSTIFQDWSWKQGSRLGSTTLRFTPSDCYETFPFPEKYESCLSSLEAPFYELRREIMTTDEIGLTDLYNRFHNPDDRDARIERLRAYQRELDEGVKSSYGWDDLELDHGFHKVGYLVEGDDVRYTISEPTRVEILRRLSRLNKERWEEDQSRAPKKGKRRGNP